MAERGDTLFLLGRDAADLAKSAEDLRVRAGKAEPIGTAVCDLEAPEGFTAALDAADAALGGFDTVIVTAALFGTQDELAEDTDFARRLLTANFANTVAFCEGVRKRLLSRGGGTLCVFSSVAGERGRKPVVIYGASKAGLSAYLEGLDHKYRADGLRTVCVKPGFVKTTMTAGLKPPLSPANPTPSPAPSSAPSTEAPPSSTPPIWALIMLLIRHLPRQVMRKIGF